MKTVICLFFTLLSLNALAQKDSIWHYNLSLGGNTTGGNYTSYESNIKGSLTKDWSKTSLSWNPSFDYSKISNSGNLQLKEREINSNFNYSTKFKSFKFYLFNGFEHSYLQQVDLQKSIGCWLGHKLILRKWCDIDLSEVIQPETMVSSFGQKYDNFAIRSSTRLKMKFTSGLFKFQSVTFYQPSLYTVKNGGTIINFKDNINWNNQSSIELQLNKLFSMGLGDNLTYESYTHSIKPTYKPLDTNFFFFIKISR